VCEALGLDPTHVAYAARCLAAGDPGPASRLVTDDIVDSMVMHGTDDEIAARLKQWVTWYSPASIALTHVTDDPVRAVLSAAAAFDAMN
jgi:hypothetical protein